MAITVWENDAFVPTLSYREATSLLYTTMLRDACQLDVGTSSHVIGITKVVHMMIDVGQHCVCILMHVKLTIHILHVMLHESHKVATYHIIIL